MVIVDALPAGFGDCLWIEYGAPRAGPIVLVDGGLGATADVIRERVRHAIKERNVDRIRIRLFVITHIDKDHINGALAFLKNPKVPVDFDEIWFNGRPQLEIGKFGRTDLLGVNEGEKLWQTLRDDYRPTWNRSQDGGPVVVPATGSLPVYPLDDTATITLLGPSPKRLQALTWEWEAVVGEFAEPEKDSEDEDLDARPDLLGKAETWPPQLLDYDDPDDATPNGSSIAFLLEVEGRKLFLTGDAFSEDLESSIRRLPGYDTSRRTYADLFKLPHHGSERNFSPALAAMLDCERYLFSTNCRQHRHPNYSTILRILASGGRRARLQFNYEEDKTICWRDRRTDVPSQFPDYDTEYPKLGMPFGHRNTWE
jgi:Metallo-beta-lactamase superfamily